MTRSKPEQDFIQNLTDKIFHAKTAKGKSEDHKGRII